MANELHTLSIGGTNYPIRPFKMTVEGDNRNDDTTPISYNKEFIFRGIKYNNKIGNPTTKSTYSYLFGLRGWSDKSGGGSHELAFNDEGIFRRNSTSSLDTWSSWSRIIDSNGGTFTGNLILHSNSGASPYIKFSRGTDSDNLCDWKIIDDAGILKFIENINGTETTGFELCTSSKTAKILGKNINDTATQSADGLMSAADKKKLDGLATVAISGLYKDLINKPESLPANGGNADTVSGFTVGCNVPANAKFTDNDTKVTEVGNHYDPTANSASELTAAISDTAGSYAKDTEYTVLTGVKAQRDAKGHVTGLTYTAQNIKDTNNSHAHSAGAGLAIDGTNTGGTAGTCKYKVNIISETKGSIELSTNDITNNTNRYYPVKLDKNGRLAVNVPWGDSNTTYTIATGDANGQIKVTPSSGTAYNVNIKGLGSLAYKNSLTENDIPALSVSKISSGKFDIARIPTGNSASTVALGNHDHLGIYAPIDYYIGGEGIRLEEGLSYTDKIDIILNSAKTDKLGGIKASHVLTTTQALTSPNSAIANRFYGVQVDSNGTAFVNIPWTDTNVKQTSLSANNSYPILMAYSSSPTTNTASQVYYNSGVYINPFLKYVYSSGFFEISDANLKNFISDIDVDLDKIKQLPKKYFTWKDDDKIQHIGTSAQEVQKIYPELVSDSDGTLTVDYAKLSVVALAAVDKLVDKQKELEDRLAKLEAIVSKLTE